MTDAGRAAVGPRPGSFGGDRGDWGEGDGGGPRTINTFKDITALARSPGSTQDSAWGAARLAHGETT